MSKLTIKHNFKIIKIGNNDKDKKNQWPFSHLFTLIRELYSFLKPLLTYTHDGRLWSIFVTRLRELFQDSLRAFSKS